VRVDALVLSAVESSVITVVVSSSRCRGVEVQVEYSNRIKILSTVRATRSVSERLNERGACLHQTKGLDARVMCEDHLNHLPLEGIGIRSIEAFEKK
jgi:hypothetical protein